jgi:hypothetical protein
LARFCAALAVVSAVEAVLMMPFSDIKWKAGNEPDYF